ncbi:MAG: signal peptidase [Chthoniobacter sp.]|nr:signal peptidase [Chthoniobacter sp.]
MKLALLVTLPLYALDQLTKWLVVRSIEFESGRTVIPGFFDLVHYGNTGAAFSSFSNSNTAFIVLSFVTLCALAFCAWRRMFIQQSTRLGVALIYAGVLGNLTDRILHQHVVDFLLFDLHVRFANPWPAFNVADSCICVATGIFIAGSFCESRRAS